jgi:hypothetical protein
VAYSSAGLTRAGQSATTGSTPLRCRFSARDPEVVYFPPSFWRMYGYFERLGGMLQSRVTPSSSDHPAPIPEEEGTGGVGFKSPPPTTFFWEILMDGGFIRIPSDPREVYGLVARPATGCIRNVEDGVIEVLFDGLDLSTILTCCSPEIGGPLDPHATCRAEEGFAHMDMKVTLAATVPSDPYRFFVSVHLGDTQFDMSTSQYSFMQAMPSMLSSGLPPAPSTVPESLIDPAHPIVTTEYYLQAGATQLNLYLPRDEAGPGPWVAIPRADFPLAALSATSLVGKYTAWQGGSRIEVELHQLAGMTSVPAAPTPALVRPFLTFPVTERIPITMRVEFDTVGNMEMSLSLHRPTLVYEYEVLPNLLALFTGPGLEVRPTLDPLPPATTLLLRVEAVEGHVLLGNPYRSPLDPLATEVLVASFRILSFHRSATMLVNVQGLKLSLRDTQHPTLPVSPMRTGQSSPSAPVASSTSPINDVTVDVRVMEAINLNLSSQQKGELTEMVVEATPVTLLLSYTDILQIRRILAQAPATSPTIPHSASAGRDFLDASSSSRSAFLQGDASIGSGNGGVKVLERADIRMAGLRLVLIDDTDEACLPMVYGSLDAMKVVAFNWSTGLTFDTSLSLLINAFNLHNSHWEPVLEPFVLSISAKRYDANPEAIAYDVDSRKKLDINASHEFISSLLQVVKVLSGPIEVSLMRLGVTSTQCPTPSHLST